MNHSAKLKFSIILVILSSILGYGGAAVCAWFYFKTEEFYWLATGSGIYIFSWILLGIAFIISGRDAYNWLKSTFLNS